jgi:hypothetical protein
LICTAWVLRGSTSDLEAKSQCLAECLPLLLRGTEIVDDLFHSLDRLRHSLGQELLRAGADLAAEEDRSVLRSDLHILERHRLRRVQLEFNSMRQLVVRTLRGARGSGDDEIVRELLHSGHLQGDPVGGAPLGWRIDRSL